MANLLSIGHTTLDTFLLVEDAELGMSESAKKVISFDFGSKIPVQDIHYGIGGGAANVAVGVKNLGHKVTIYTILGDDLKGRDAKESLIDFGIDDSQIVFDENNTDQSTVVSYGQDRVIFSYNYAREYEVGQVNHKYPFIYVSSIGKNIERIYKQIADIKAENPEKTVFFTPGSRELKDKRNEIGKFIEHVDYLMVNVEEACTILNQDLKRDQINMSDLMDLLIQKGVKNVVITDGENGAYVASEKEEHKIAAKPTNFVEKTGAGDAFASGFMSAIMYEKGLEEAGQWGVTNASAVMQVVGAQNGLLKKVELEKQLSGDKD